MSNGKFRLSERAAEITKRLALPVPAQKLFLALIYEQEQERDGWPTAATLMERGCGTFHRPLSRFRALGCAPKANNARFFQQAVSALASGPTLLDRIEFCPRHQAIIWSFGPVMHDFMADMGVYALLSVSDLRRISRGLDLALLAQITLHQKKRLPEFLMFQYNPIFEPSANCLFPDQIDLRATRARLEPALRSWARHTGYSFLVGYEQPPGRPVYHQARIRFHTETSTWKDAAFQRFPPNTKIVKVCA